MGDADQLSLGRSPPALFRQSTFHDKLQAADPRPRVRFEGLRTGANRRSDKVNFARIDLAMQGSHPGEGWEKAAVSQKQQVLRNNAARPGIYRMPVMCPASFGCLGYFCLAYLGS